MRKTTCRILLISLVVASISGCTFSDKKKSINNLRLSIWHFSEAIFFFENNKSTDKDRPYEDTESREKHINSVRYSYTASKLVDIEILDEVFDELGSRYQKQFITGLEHIIWIIEKASTDAGRESLSDNDFVTMMENFQDIVWFLRWYESNEKTIKLRTPLF